MRRWVKTAAMTGGLLLAGGMAGCAAVQGAASSLGFGGQDMAADATPLPGELETVHAAAIVQDEAVFWVASNGCTTKADLTPVVRAGREGPVITLRRIKADICETPAPEGVEVRWTFQEMGLTPGARVSVDNPYQLTATAS